MTPEAKYLLSVIKRRKRVTPFWLSAQDVYARRRMRRDALAELFELGYVVRDKDGWIVPAEPPIRK